MPDVVELLKMDIEKGFSKSQLEMFIGLPKNILSGVLSGKRKLSQKSIVKIERFMASEKPDPFAVKNIKSTDRKKPMGNEKPALPTDTKKETSPMPDPKNKTEYFKWLKNNQ